MRIRCKTDIEKSTKILQFKENLPKNLKITEETTIDYFKGSA